MAVNIALVRMIYPAERLGRGVGLNALVVGVAFSAGPTIASLVLAVASWPWLFAVNVPLGVLAYALARNALPHAAPRGQRFDPTTALLTAATFAALIFGLGAAAQREPWPLVAAAARRGARRRHVAAAAPGRATPRRCCRWTCCAVRCSRSRR